MSFLTLLTLPRGVSCGLPARSPFGLLVGALLTLCIWDVQVFSSCVCLVLFLLISSSCCWLAPGQLVLPCQILELVALCATDLSYRIAFGVVVC